jgi:hypothetical protein
MKLVTWNQDEAKRELLKRLTNAKDQRKDLTYIWQANERTVYNTTGGSTLSADVSVSLESDQAATENFGDSNSTVGTNFVFKNLRYIHAQLSANPPSVIPQPTSNDPDDRRSADAADRMVKFAMRQYNMMEKIDATSLNTLVYGTGFMKTIWDSTAGDVLEYDEETGEMTMEGDFSVTVPNPWDILIDPEATTWDEVRFVFERIYMPYEQACYLYPKAKEILEKNRIMSGDNRRRSEDGSNSAVPHRYYDSVELYQYWEKGLPTNGFLGRFCVCTRNGEPITEVKPNPERYKGVRKGKTEASVTKAVLPFHIFTDIDVPNQIWGKSFVEFTSALQDNLNRLDSVLLENVQAHGVARIILPEGTEISDDSITNSPYDIVRITGSQPPHFMSPMALPSGMDNLRNTLKMGIDESSGVNEAMFGQQSREQSGFSMQYATNQGNMIRRRLFNKYTALVENVYKRFLLITQKHWTTPRTIHVLGKEKAFEAIDIKGSDISSGYDLTVAYGTSMSLDPTTRREEILTLMPLFEKAGVEPRTLLGMMKLNELSGMYDILQLAEDRQREIFEEMIASGMYIPPEELQDHKNMLAFAYKYLMTTEFKYLPENSKNLVRQHVLDREQLAAQAAPPPAAAPVMPALPGMPPV